MAGHSKYKNIMHRKGAQDKKRANIFTKLVREIIVAAKSGGADENFNARLRVAIAAAKSANMPKDRIENAINKATSNSADSNYEEVRYEGFGPGSCSLIVEGLTDNRNRTAEIRAIFGKNGGNMGEIGSVSYMFQKIGLILYEKKAFKSFDDALNATLEVLAEDCIEHDECYEIICKQEEFHAIKDALMKKYGEPIEHKITWKSSNVIFLKSDELRKAEKLVDALEDSDDVQTVSHNFEPADE